MTFPTYEKWGEKVAEQVIDVYLINGRTIREWIEILSDELTMLDKIREEIDQIEINGHIRDVECFSAGINTALNVIDKYREGEEE